MQAGDAVDDLVGDVPVLVEALLRGLGVEIGPLGPALPGRPEGEVVEAPDEAVVALALRRPHLRALAAALDGSLGGEAPRRIGLWRHLAASQATELLRLARARGPPRAELRQLAARAEEAPGKLRPLCATRAGADEAPAAEKLRAPCSAEVGAGHEDIVDGESLAGLDVAQGPVLARPVRHGRSPDARDEAVGLAGVLEHAAGEHDVELGVRAAEAIARKDVHKVPDLFEACEGLQVRPQHREDVGDDILRDGLGDGRAA
mmetsp:Transcript_87461/g.243570  ORF Transcript_87461/g.243570 Transcript_87461/m.243570 type:complete len:260 (+) Transcript_87461:496-1275(+)